MLHCSTAANGSLYYYIQKCTKSRKNGKKRREIQKTVTETIFAAIFHGGETHNSSKNAFFLYNSAKKKKNGHSHYGGIL